MKIGVIGIIVEGDKLIASKVQQLLSDNDEIIRGRMGVPNLAKNVKVISLTVVATNEQISSLTGKLGQLKGVKVKSAVTDIDI